MNASTDGAARCRTLAGENTSPAPSVARRAAVRRLAPLTIPIVALVLHFTPHAADFLQFDRAALARGQLWRLVTCHAAHFNASHLLWDVATFALLACLLPRFSVRTWSALLGGSALVISAGVWVLQPRFEFYRGLSGIDCALFSAVVTLRIREAFDERDRAALTITTIAALGFVAKCLFELITQTSAFVADGEFVPVPLAHLLGGTCGAAFVTLHRQLQGRPYASTQP